MREATDLGPLYKRWRDAAYSGLCAPISADNPWLGRYRIKHKDRPWTPISIEMRAPVDPETGELDGDEEIVAIVGFRGMQMEVNPLDSPSQKHDWQSWWLWAASNPVTDEAYMQAFETGTWADDAPGSNQGPPADSFEGLCEQLDSAIGFAGKFQAIEDKSTADQVANLKDRIYGLSKALDAMRDAEKRPHDEASKAVQARFVPSILKANAAVDALRSLLKPWLKGLEDQAKAAAVAAGGSATSIEVKARAGGMTGKRTSTRKLMVVTIEDFPAAFSYLLQKADENGGNLDHEIVGAAVKVIERRAKTGEAIPGVKITEEIKVI